MTARQWRIDGARVRELRTKRAMTLPELAAKAGISERALGDIERGVSAARPETIRCLATVLEVAPEELLDAGDAPAPAPAPALPPPKLPARTRLDALADLQRTRGIAPAPVRIGKESVDVLTPARMQDVFARHAAFEGARFAVEGIVDAQRALSPAEARALKAKVGVGARFHVVSEVVAGEPLGVTVHAVDARTADALQAAMGKRVRVVVRVRLAGDEEKRAVAVFMSERKRAWGFVAERVGTPD